MKYTEFWYDLTNALVNTSGDEEILGKISLEEIDNTALGIYKSLINRRMHHNQLKGYAEGYGAEIGRGVLTYQRLREEMTSAA